MQATTTRNQPIIEVYRQGSAPIPIVISTSNTLFKISIASCAILLSRYASNIAVALVHRSSTASVTRTTPIKTSTALSALLRSLDAVTDHGVLTVRGDRASRGW